MVVLQYQHTIATLGAHFVFVQIDGMLHSCLQILDLVADCVHVLLDLHGVSQALQIFDDLGLGNKNIRFELRLDGSQ